MKFLIGVAIERSQTAEMIVEVDADDLKSARFRAESVALSLVRDNQSLLRQIARKLDRLGEWDAEVHIDAHHATDAYDPTVFAADVGDHLHPVPASDSREKREKESDSDSGE